VNRLTDPQLLRDYTEHRSEVAFTELVRRHVDLVYSAALRMVCDAHLAEDVTQGAFVALAQSAPSLTDHPVLSGWLHRTTQNLASKAVRSDVRRRAREQEAATMNELLSDEPNAVWEHIAPHLDAALGELGEADRDALLLRYFERKSASEMAQTLGISDEAAQKRVSRAVERLREFFTKRGITVGASGLVLVITANAVQAAPVGLAVTISTAAALAGTITTATIATHTTMNLINVKAITAIVISAIVAGTTTYVIKEGESNQLRAEIQNLNTQKGNMTDERDSALNTANARNEELEQLRKGNSDLLRLRGEVAMLRKQTADLQTVLDHYRQLRASSAEQQAQAQSDLRISPFVYVSGQVRSPGRLVWTNGMSLKNIIVAAGGFTDLADATRIRITQKDGDTTILNYSDSDGSKSANTRILQNDSIVIPQLSHDDAASMNPDQVPAIADWGAPQDKILAKLAKVGANILTNTADVIVAEIDPDGLSSSSGEPITHPIKLEFHFRDGKLVQSK